ncbi:pyridoxal-dependent decarboxylase domain protein [Babesia caballi]|uniref:Pyridoxal-dependent decarboxylase domain protein n=1 Tax=Babesia caballi TaxID=5871 RepID=A0AAV4LVC8_BABCB|nr:pyridoxal-dependent decarboxylase domain protein [Babesia caballi]
MHVRSNVGLKLSRLWTTCSTKTMNCRKWQPDECSTAKQRRRTSDATSLALGTAGTEVGIHVPADDPKKAAAAETVGETASAAGNAPKSTKPSAMDKMRFITLTFWRESDLAMHVKCTAKVVTKLTPSSERRMAASLSSRNAVVLRQNTPLQEPQQLEQQAHVARDERRHREFEPLGVDAVGREYDVAQHIKVRLRQVHHEAVQRAGHVLALERVGKVYEDGRQDGLQVLVVEIGVALLQNQLQNHREGPRYAARG